ncbi:ketopantoate reductase family protein [Desulfospira joergensenii]|uniref:ketopantoate reductase family protein n=1 Tax=Desulfospira joergensenii TaxID=53329 RepID=UPI0003B379B4|nr:2-dehydropantoate 2-reductase [Desulfospira joergensenii]
MNQGSKNLKVAVVGAGAIGGICAGLIAKAGYDVQVVVRRPEHADEIMSKGIRISGIRGSHRVKIQAVSRIEDMKADRDVVLLGVKATAMTDVVEKMDLKPSAVLVSLQNGFCEQALARIIGPDRVMGCVTGWGATMHGACDLEMTSLGDFILGSMDNKEDPRLEQVQEILNHVLETKISPNIQGSLYSKLIINSCITSTGALCGLALGPMLAKKRVRQVFLEIMKEAMAVARGLDIKVEVFAGRLNYYTFLKAGGAFAEWKRHLFLRILGFKYRRLKSSSLQSLERGEKTEIEFLTGFITSNARNLGIPVPVNDQVLTMVREIEAGRRKISSANIDQIQF